MQEEHLLYLRTILRGWPIIFLGSLIAKFAGFFRQFVIIRSLSPEQYGLFILGFTFLNIFTWLGHLGLCQGSQRFIAYYDAKGRKSEIKGIIYTTLKIVGISGVLIFLILILISGTLANLLSKPDFKTVLMIYSFIIPIAILNSVIASFFLGFQRAGIAEIINDITPSIISVIFIYVSLQIKKSLYSPIVALGISYLLILIFALFFYIKSISYKLRSFIPIRTTGKLLRFSLPLLLASMSSVVLNQTDTLMLGYFAASESVGFYNAAFLLAVNIAIFLNSMGTIFLPVFTKVIANEDEKVAKIFYQVVTRWLFIVTLPLFLTFFLFPSQILTLIFTRPYSRAASCLTILAGAEFLNTFLGPNSQALTAFGETKLLMKSWFMAAVSNIAMNYVFIPKWGINGAAIATGASLVILNFINSTYLYIKHKMHPFGRKYVVPVAVCAGMASLLYLPLRGLVKHSSWFVLICYPLFLALGIIFTLVTRSVSEEDLIVYRALKARIRVYTGNRARS